MTDSQILVAGADPAQWPIVRSALEGAWATAFAVDLRGTLDVLGQDGTAILLLCSDLLDASSERCVDRVRERHPELPVLVIGARNPDRGPSRRVAYLPGKSVPQELAGAIRKMLEPREESALSASAARQARRERFVAPAYRPTPYVPVAAVGPKA